MTSLDSRFYKSKNWGYTGEFIVSLSRTRFEISTVELDRVMLEGATHDTEDTQNAVTNSRQGQRKIGMGNNQTRPLKHTDWYMQDNTEL